MKNQQLYALRDRLLSIRKGLDPKHGRRPLSDLRHEYLGSIKLLVEELLGHIDTESSMKTWIPREIEQINDALFADKSERHRAKSKQKRSAAILSIYLHSYGAMYKAIDPLIGELGWGKSSALSAKRSELRRQIGEVGSLEQPPEEDKEELLCLMTSLKAHIENKEGVDDVKKAIKGLEENLK